MSYAAQLGKRTTDRYEQVCFFSDAEFLRRHHAVIEKMQERDVDLLLIADPKLEGFGVWLTYDMLCDYVMLDREGTVTVVYGHDYGKGKDFTVHAERRTRLKPVKSPVPNTCHRTGVDVGYVSSMIARSRRIGVINRHALRKGLYDMLLAETPGLEFVDMRVDVGIIRVVRSPEEQQAIAYTASAQEKLMAAVPMLMREGMYMRDVILELTHYATELGCGRDEIQIFAMRCGLENDGQEYPRFVPIIPSSFDAPGKIEKGWIAQIMLEMNSFGGLMLDTGRLFSMGEPHPVTLKAWEDARKIQLYAVDLLRPGMTCRKIMRMSQEYAASIGRNLAFGNFCHGLGNSRTESPDVRDETTCDIPFSENMHLLCEPNIVYSYGKQGPESVILIPDSYYVSKDGGIPTTKISHEIFVID